jgi:hypothetical protein
MKVFREDILTMYFEEIIHNKKFKYKNNISLNDYFVIYRGDSKCHHLVIEIRLSYLYLHCRIHNE